MMAVVSEFLAPLPAMPSGKEANRSEAHRRLLVIVMGAAGALSLLGGCGGNPEENTDCVAVGLELWQNLDERMTNTSRVADRLGTDDYAVRQGAVGPADCPSGISGDDIAKGEIVTVEGVPEELGAANRCLAIATAAELEPDETARIVGVVCPAEYVP